MKILKLNRSFLFKFSIALGVFKCFKLKENLFENMTYYCNAIKSESCKDLKFDSLKEEDFSKCETYLAEKLKQKGINITQNKFEKEDWSFLKTILVNMQDINSKYLKSIEIEIERNIKPKLDNENRIDCFENDKSTFKSINIDLLINMINEAEKKVFVKDQILSTYEKIDDRLYKYKNDFFEIFINDKNNYSLKFNSNNCKNTPLGLILFFDMVDFLEKNNVCYNKTLGYLNSNIDNLGNGMKFNIKTNLKLNKDLKMDNELIKKISENSNNTIQLISSSEGLEFRSKNSFSSLSNTLLEILNVKSHIKPNTNFDSFDSI